MISHSSCRFECELSGTTINEQPVALFVNDHDL